jgi:hypothetical protein
MHLVAGSAPNGLLSLTNVHTPNCTEVRAAVAYSDGRQMDLLERCLEFSKPLTFYGRYDATGATSPKVVKWFLDRKSLSLKCKLVPGGLHAKVIWWVGVGAYIGSANLSHRAWFTNIEAGTFLTEKELEENDMLEDLATFFEQVEERAQTVDDTLYRHLLALAKLAALYDKALIELQQKFEVKRLFPEAPGLTVVTDSRSRAFQQFQKQWRQTLQVLRDIGALASSEEYRPAWLPADVSAGAQADQFIHAYYYRFIKAGRDSRRIGQSYEANRANPDAALREALAWWKAADFDYSGEQQTLLVEAKKLQRLLARDHISRLSKDEFVEALSQVHSIIDYASKQGNVELGLENKPQSIDVKVARYTELMWDWRSATGQSTLEMLQHVLWGPGEPEQRIWAALKTPQWRIRQIGLSTLAETLGWARPDEFPPRNDRTVGGLRALGHAV